MWNYTLHWIALDSTGASIPLANYKVNGTQLAFLTFNELVANVILLDVVPVIFSIQYSVILSFLPKKQLTSLLGGPCPIFRSPMGNYTGETKYQRSHDQIGAFRDDSGLLL